MPEHNNNIKTRLYTGNSAMWIILPALLLLAAFAVWTAFLSNSFFDQKVFDFIAPHITAGRTRFILFITFLGNGYFLVPANILLLLFFIYKKNKWWAIRVALISLSSVGLMTLLKILFHRHRPAAPLVDGITNFSFPSGHAFMSVATYGLLAYWFANTIKQGWWRRTLIIFCFLLILLISFTRIYLRVHYTTDIIAGLTLGTAWFIFTSFITDKLEAKDNRKKEIVKFISGIQISEPLRSLRPLRWKYINHRWGQRSFLPAGYKGLGRAG